MFGLFDRHVLDANTMNALSMMRCTHKSWLLVAEGDRFVGVVTRKDMLKFLALKIDQEE